jgi:hypothetical protein
MQDKRKGQKIHCHSKIASDDVWHISEAMFVPSHVQPDLNAESVHIFRCELQQSEHDVSVLRAMNRTENLHIKLKRTEGNNSNIILSEFSVPWSLRFTGLFRPVHSIHPQHMWTLPLSRRASYYLTLPGLDMPDPSTAVALLSESVHHHLSIGFSRIFVSTSHDLTSPVLTSLLETFSDFIASGRLLFFSSFIDKEHLSVEEVLPNSIDLPRRSFLNLLFNNMCLYLTKGSARFLGVWDLDEFLIPHPPFVNVHAIVQHSLPSRDAKLTFCGLTLNSAVILSRFPHSDIYFPLGRAFNTSELRDSEALGLNYIKSIIPTWRVFHIGLHLPGACKLPWRYTSCASQPDNDFCFSSPVYKDWISLKQKCSMYWLLPHDFDDFVCESNSHRINVSIAEIYHIQVRRKDT